MGRASHLRARHVRVSLRSDDLRNGFSRLQASNVGTNREQRNCASEVWHSLRIAPARNDLRTEPSRNRRETTSGPSIGCVHGYLAPVCLGIGHKFSQAVPPARVAGIREPRVASSRNGGFKRQEVLDIRRAALRPLPLGRLLVGNRFRGGIHVAVIFASSAKKNGFNCVSPLMRLHRDATNGQAQTVRSASAKKYPAR
jgi:hypothetical protein